MDLYNHLYSSKDDADIFVDDSEVNWIAPQSDSEFKDLMDDLRRQGVLD